MPRRRLQTDYFSKSEAPLPIQAVPWLRERAGAAIASDAMGTVQPYIRSTISGRLTSVILAFQLPGSLSALAGRLPGYQGQTPRSCRIQSCKPPKHELRAGPARFLAPTFSRSPTPIAVILLFCGLVGWNPDRCLCLSVTGCVRVRGASCRPQMVKPGRGIGPLPGFIQDEILTARWRICSMSISSMTVERAIRPLVPRRIPSW